MRILLTIFLFFSLTASYSQSAENIHLAAESALYVSGDLVRLQLVVQDPSGSPVSGDRLIHTFLVDHQGNIVLKRKFMITTLDKAGFIQLPEELKTGNYKLVAALAGAANRTELILPVYNPSIFASSIPPSNADTQKSIREEMPESGLLTFSAGSPVIARNSELSIDVPAGASDGIMLTKIYDPRYDTPPVLGEVKQEAVPEAVEDKLSFNYISTDPNSRISLYFVEQGYVEEFYLAEESRILEKLPAMFGSGHIYAYQFDAQGNRLGEIPVEVQRASRMTFTTFSNQVPFDTRVRSLLEKKRVRKYIAQIYRTGDEPVVSLMEEEYNTEPDRHVELKNFSGVATLREALANITPKTQVIRRDKSYELRLSPENSGYRYQDGPFILLENVPTFSLDSLIEMSAADVESIDVFISLEKLRRFGTFGRYGAVAINLKRPDENPLQDKLANIPVYYGVSDLVGEDTAPDGPDLRPVAYWNPAQRVINDNNVTVRWRPTDVAGEYKVWSMLISPEGSVTKSSKSITVTAN